MQQLFGNSKLVKVADAAVSAGTAINGDSVDTQGWDGVVFFTSIPTADADNHLKAQESADDSSFADLEGSAAVAGDDDDVVAVEVNTPVKRYARPVLIRAGADTASVEIYALLYGSRNAPQSNPSGVVSVTLVSPVAGTP